MTQSKYILKCTACGKVYESFAEWFAAGQKCECGCARAEAEYNADYSKLAGLPKDDSFMRKYFDFLPVVERENVVTDGEGCTPIERWSFLEDWARENGTECEVYVTRNDLSKGTGTFKDPAGALAASLFKENGVKEFCIASTGNTATAYAHYLAKAGIKYTVFVPSEVSQDTIDAIRAEGQTCVVVDGNYADAKAAAAAYAKEHNCLISAGNVDPIRIESKRTFVVEMLQAFGGKLPDVYFQSVAGGTLPIALDKCLRELKAKGIDIKPSRMILAQQDKCNPMVQSWEKAVAAGFPEGWEKDFVKVEPETDIIILSNGIPGMYPIVGPIVRRSGGAFVTVSEDETPATARWILENKGIILGPASIVCVEGFMEAVRKGLIHKGEKVLINYGEGCGRNTKFKNKVIQ